MAKITIANPMYDVIFKYLLEDLNIAKGLIARIIECEIETIEVHSQETMQETDLAQLPGIRLLRLDFKAVIWVKKESETPKKEVEYERKKVLIELQKSKELMDILRFRKYLAENYAKADTIVNSIGKNETEILPIITIYFLGFKLDNIAIPVLKVAKKYENVLEHKEVYLSKKEGFVDLLTHESYMIQVQRLEEYLRTPLENILLVFSQKYTLKGDEHRLEVEENANDDLVEEAQRRLARAAGDEGLRKKMDIEDEMERTILSKFRAFEEQLAEANQKTETEKQRAESEKQRAESEKQRAESEKQRAESEKQRADDKEEKLRLSEQKALELEAKLAELDRKLRDKE